MEPRITILGSSVELAISLLRIISQLAGGTTIKTRALTQAQLGPSAEDGSNPIDWHAQQAGRVGAHAGNYPLEIFFRGVMEEAQSSIETQWSELQFMTRMEKCQPARQDAEPFGAIVISLSRLDGDHPKDTCGVLLVYCSQTVKDLARGQQLLP